MKKKLWFAAFDYGQLEARIIAMASKDNVFADACTEGYDIHYDLAEKFLNAYPPLAGLEHRNEITKGHIQKFRGFAKTNVTFPWIYDSHFKSTAKLLKMPEDIVERLHAEFWEKFWEIKAWKETVHKSYFKKGYVSTLYGSRRHGPLSFTKRVNTIIQGTGGYINMASMNRLSRQAYKLDKPQYQARLNIHDDLSFALPDESLEEDIRFIAKEMCRKTHDWMWRVPLQVEVCLGENWADLEEVATFDTRNFEY